MKIIFKFFVAIFFLGFLTSMTACSTGQCSNVPARPTEADNAKQAINMNDNDQIALTKPVSDDTIQVFKDSGEKQCGQGAATPLEGVKASLEKAHVKVLDSRTQDDGLMHMQLCGAPSGKIHVFTIDKKSLKKAKRLGFKPLPKA